MVVERVLRGPVTLPTVHTSPSHEIDREAQPILLGELPPIWIRNDVAGGQDYGLDYLVQTVEAQAPTGVRFGVQLKGIRQPSVIRDAIHFPFPTKNLGTYLVAESLPVFLVVADVTTKRAYFLFLQQFADEHLRDEDWAEQGHVTVRVPLENRVSDHERLRRAAREAASYMLAARASPAMVLSQRARALERLDPRFLILARATEHGEVYELRPKGDEPIRFGVNVAGLDPERKALLRRGHPVPVSGGEIVFRDLPIFERIAHMMTEVTIAARIECTATIEVERDGIVASIVNVPAKVTFGLDEMRFEAAYRNAPIDVHVALQFLNADDRRQATSAVEVRHSVDERWFGQRLDQLAHFDRLHALARVAAKPYNFRALLHIPGHEDFEIPWGGPVGEERAGHDVLMAVLDELQRARETCRILGITPVLRKEVLQAGFGDLAILHPLLTVGECEGDASSVQLEGFAREPNDLTKGIAETKGRPSKFECVVGGAERPWTLLGCEVGGVRAAVTLTKARCTLSQLPDGRIRILAKGTRRSRYFVKRID